MLSWALLNAKVVSGGIRTLEHSEEAMQSVIFCCRRLAANEGGFQEIARGTANAFACAILTTSRIDIGREI